MTKTTIESKQYDFYCIFFQLLYFIFWMNSKRLAYKNKSFLFRNVVNVIKTSACIFPSFHCLLNHFLVLFKILVHQFCSFSIKRFLEIFSINMLQKMQQTNNNLIKFIIGFPSFPQNWKANISLFINVWMENFIQTFYFWLRERVICGCFIGEGDFRMRINCVLSWHDSNMKFSDFSSIWECNLYIGDFILLISLKIFHHSLISSLRSGFLLFFSLLFDSFLFEIFKHPLKKFNKKIINQRISLKFLIAFFNLIWLHFRIREYI